VRSSRWWCDLSRFMAIVAAPSQRRPSVTRTESTTSDDGGEPNTAEDEQEPPPREVQARSRSARRAAQLLLTSAVLLCLYNSALLVVFGVRDVIDLARDYGGCTAQAAQSAAQAAQARVPEAMQQVGEWLGAERKAAFCWPAIELTLTRTNESVPTLVDATLQQMHECYPNARRFLDLVAPPQNVAAKRPPWAWMLGPLAPADGADAEETKGALRLLLEYMYTDEAPLDVWQTLINATQELGAATTATMKELNLIEQTVEVLDAATIDTAKQATNRVAQGALSLLMIMLGYVWELLLLLLGGINTASFVGVFFSFALSLLALPDDPFKMAR
jgi:hypothetical protein